jgi:uncharacterized protein (DUF305 family)
METGMPASIRYRLKVIILTSFVAGTVRAASPEEAAFLAENQVAMDRMMADMAIHPTGDIDHDFVAMMIPHHQGAIDMALAELRDGHNEALRRIAQGIIVEQRQEIVAMHLIAGDTDPAAPAVTRAHHHETGTTP